MAKPTDQKQDNSYSSSVRRTSKVNPFITLIDTVGDITYVGKAAPGTSTSESTWQIMKIDSSSNPTTVLYADSNINFDNVWDNRGSLSYG